MAMLIRVATGLEEKLNIFGDDYQQLMEQVKEIIFISMILLTVILKL